MSIAKSRGFINLPCLLREFLIKWFLSPRVSGCSRISGKGKVKKMFIPDRKFFDALEKIKPVLEDLNSGYVKAFEAFLKEPGNKTLDDIHSVEEEEFFERSTDSFGYMNTLYSISKIVTEELREGFVLLTSGTKCVSEALDRYHEAVFMIRRPLFMGPDGHDAALTKEAKDHILNENISPAALSYMALNEYGAEPEEVLQYWSKVYLAGGRKRESEYLTAGRKHGR